MRTIFAALVCCLLRAAPAWAHTSTAGLAWAVGGGLEYRVTDAIAIRTGVNYMRTSRFDPSLTLGRSNIRGTASIVHSFLRRAGRGRLA